MMGKWVWSRLLLGVVVGCGGLGDEDGRGSACLWLVFRIPSRFGGSRLCVRVDVVVLEARLDAARGGSEFNCFDVALTPS